LHPSPLDLVPPLIFYYHLEHNFVLDRILFAQTLAIVPHLSLGGLFEMVYEHLSRCFILKDPSSRFSELFKVIVVIIHGDTPKLDTPKSVALVSRASRLLAIANDINGLHLIVVGKMFLQLISHSIVLQFWGLL
jgi:hypothetical protein